MDSKQFKKDLDALRNFVHIQGQDGNWNHDDYMCGLYNGLECALATIERREPKYKYLKNLETRYGLVWEDKIEQIAEQCKREFPVLIEDKSKEIICDSENNCGTNLIIEGDNYHSLYTLSFTHKNKIDIIYIDPPYNTGAKDWKYNNDYVDKNDLWRHSKWVSMMYRRLCLAKNLLNEDGIIVCSIDEYEIHNLRHLLDIIFNENNKLGMITVLHNPKGRNLAKFFSSNSEYMLIYAKDITKAKFNDVAIDEKAIATFNETDKEGNFRLEPFMRVRSSWLRTNKPKNWYPIYVSKDLKTITLTKENNYYEIFPTSKGKDYSWKNIAQTFRQLNNNGYFVAQREKESIQILHKYRENQVFKNVWIDKKYHSEFHGTNLLKKILGKNIFSYPKSLYLLIDILKIISKKNSLILDFFAGSGTTGHAVLELNKEDGGNRKFILCNNNENNICEEVTYQRIKKVIEGYNDKEPLPANVKYFKTGFVPHNDSTEYITSKTV